MPISCPSAITRVVVHARGALVTRDVALPVDLPDGAVDVVVPGIPLLAEPGSARAATSGERAVVAVHAGLVVPEGEAAARPTLERVRELAGRLRRIDDELGALSERRENLEPRRPQPTLRVHDGKRERDRLDARFDDALRMTALLRDKVRAIDDRMDALAETRRDVARALEAARLEERQAPGPARRNEASRSFTVRLLGGGPARLSLTYAVRAARWWPTYTLRVTGDEAAWAFEALVAQHSGEDWSGVELALSSADLVFDARLPELASLRFGRAQPPARPLYRPPPIGVAEMFAGYLASAPPIPQSRAPEPVMDEPVAVFAEAFDDASAGEVRKEQDAAMRMTKKRAVVPKPAPSVAYGAVPGGFGPPALSAAPAPAPQAKGGGGMMMRSMAFEAASLGGFAEEPEPEPEPEVVPSEAWSDHDALVLAPPTSPRRGHLVPAPSGGAAAAAKSEARIDALAGAQRELVDPLVSRGMFDHRYEAQGRADVPSDGRLHRVPVATGTSRPELAWTTVPGRAADVHREAKLVNPFATGLLGGPVDVYLDGSLLTTTAIERIDRGGALTIGMGVDERFKVARNVRTSEEATGLLGGSIAVTHTVSIELTSTVKEAVKVTVLERIPVSDDKNVEVKLLDARPPPSDYDQADRGEPVRGGKRFVVTVTPEKKTTAELVYRVVFPQKLDLVGGSRRD